MSGKQLLAIGAVCLTGTGVVIGITLCVFGVVNGMAKVINHALDECCDVFENVIDTMV